MSANELTPGERIATGFMGYDDPQLAATIDEAIAEAVYDATIYYDKDGKEVTVQAIAKKLERERDSLKEKLAAKEAECAAMRGVLLELKKEYESAGALFRCPQPREQGRS